VVAGRACLALARLGWAIGDLLVREAAWGGAEGCDGHGTRPTSPHAVDRRSAGGVSDACREHSTKARPQRQGGENHPALGGPRAAAGVTACGTAVRHHGCCAEPFEPLGSPLDLWAVVPPACV